MTTATADRTKLLARIERVRAIVDHPRTNEHLRAVAAHKLEKLLVQLGNVNATVTTARQGRTWYGAKYDHTGAQRTTDIAKLIREEIKLARKLAKDGGGAPALIDPIGDAPASIKFGVRSEYFSGGSAIDITVKGVPQEWGWEQKKNEYGRMRWVHTPAMRALFDELKKVMAAYNHDGSDIMTDYFDVRFYGSVETVWDEEPR
jgi:hypothetical protein